MDRCEFISSLSSSSNTSIEDYILNYFNEIMLLYNLFGNCDNVTISIDNGVVNPFNIVFNNTKDALKMHNCINRLILRIYNNKYIINSKVDGKIIKVSLENVAGMV